MTEKVRAVLFSTHVNRMIVGKRPLDLVKDGELSRLMETAEKVYHTDFSVDSKIRESLWRQLQEHLIGNSARELEEGELSDEELSGTAAAFGGYRGERCPLCGAFVARGEACSFCRMGK